MASYRKRGKNWYFRYSDEHGKSVVRRGCSDLGMTKRLAAEAEKRAAAIREGTADPRDYALAEAARRPVLAHVDDWRAAMLSRGTTSTHAALCHSRVTRTLALAGIERLAELTLDRVERAVGRVRDELGLSDQSVHHAAVVVKAFSRWLWLNDRTREHRLAKLKPPRVVSTNERGVLTPDQLSNLITTTRTAPESFGMSGEDRAVLYLVASQTGFRARELGHLVPDDFRLNDPTPTIICRASATKNRKRADQPIRADLAGLLRPWVAGKAKGQAAIFALPHSRNVSRMIRKDMEAAGIATVDASGNRMDFHGLRHFFCTQLVLSGVPAKVAQELARHSTPQLTLNRYAHVRVHDLARGLDALPAAVPVQAEPVAVVSTGTDGPIKKLLAHYLPIEGSPLVAKGRMGTDR
jgi:integrase